MIKGRICLLICVVFFCFTSTAQKVRAFGAQVAPEGFISTSELVSQMKNTDSLKTKVKVEIQEVCKKKGCWMNVNLSDGTSMLVRFKDYAFFVPTNCDGKTAVLEGVAFKEEVSVEMLRHYAEDGGKSKKEIAKITQPETKLLFEANGVLLYD